MKIKRRLNMKTVVLILFVAVALGHVLCDLDPPSNSSGKDMYVVHATVYQVGILTNKSDEELEKTQGNQESITFYHHNGSVDLSGIRSPLLTNVTAQSMVGVSPVQDTNHSNTVLPWSALQKLASLPQPRAPEELETNANDHTKTKRDVASVPVKLEKGSAVIPPGTRVHSLALPALITLNNNLSQIPVPIPNMSVVRYAKINTIVKNPHTPL